MRAYVKAMTKVEAKSPSGVLSSYWSYAFHFYAEPVDQKNIETFSNLMPGAKKTITLKTWFRNDLKRDMRVVFQDEEYDIISVNPGFKTMSIDCERVDI